MSHEELFTIPSQRDGLGLSVMAVEPDGAPRALVQFAHGMAEHKERYLPFMEFLADHGYRMEKCQCVDMFGQTGHIETVCLLSKLSEAKHHISVQVDMDELELTSAESKATYEEIQEWVQEKYGFHVTHLNIAQVKRKHGIIERENYNKPKSLDSRQPGCPEEKVKAIEAALKHFRMI